jgi:phytoene dehydrogenase-like protein
MTAPPDPPADPVVIIGAGIGGLTAAALLARHGLRVLVLEAHSRPGGACTSWTRRITRDGRALTYVFDAGVQDISGVVDRGPLRQLLRRLDAESRIRWLRVRHHYARDGLRLTAAADAAALVGDLGAAFPGDRAGTAAFFAEMEAIYRELYLDIEHSGGVPVAPADAAGRTRWAERRPHASRWLHRPFAALLDHHLSDPRLKALLTILSDYITDDPARLSVGDMAPLFGYYFDGGYYPAGGSQRLPDTLSAIIAEHGGTVLLRTTVTRVLIENGRATGVETADGRRFPAATVVADGDVRTLLETLVGREHLPRRYAARLRTLARGPSAVLVSLGLDSQPDLPARVFIHHDGLEFGIGNPSAIDPSLAPEGHAAMTLVCLRPTAEPAVWSSAAEPAVWSRGVPDYPARKAAFADRLIAAVEATVWPELSRHIRFREEASPASFARYLRTEGGNIYGAARGQWLPGVRSPIPGLLLVGGGTASGAGIEAVVVSGTLAANLILEQRLEQPVSGTAENGGESLTCPV